jgi:cytochrome c oxidase subunit 2
MTNIRDTDSDPFKGELLSYEIDQRNRNLGMRFNEVVNSDSGEGVINLDYVFFATGSATLTEDSQYELDYVANILSENPDVTFELAGHTDNQGRADSNLSLSQARAESVAEYLTRKGISTDRMTARGYGDTDPVETNDTAEGRQANRRTELKILSKSEL